ncbi:hypothetical protein M405DRAFT_823579 [Rhizopogon salebrosus TDB-379]|nr:hypothetical protein M405DRAFT_823579 [Rhizopogon salebrosus TDB-379]
MAAAMQQAGGNAGDGSTLQGQAIAGAQGSQVHTTGQPSHATQLQSSATDAGEPSSYEMGCCGFVFNLACRRSA